MFGFGFAATLRPAIARRVDPIVTLRAEYRGPVVSQFG
jgi:hypothetical protein